MLLVGLVEKVRTLFSFLNILHPFLGIKYVNLPNPSFMNLKGSMLCKIEWLVYSHY